MFHESINRRWVAKTVELRSIPHPSDETRRMEHLLEGKGGLEVDAPEGGAAGVEIAGERGAGAEARGAEGAVGRASVGVVEDVLGLDAETGVVALAAGGSAAPEAAASAAASPAATRTSRAAGTTLAASLLLGDRDGGRTGGRSRRS